MKKKYIYLLLLFFITESFTSNIHAISSKTEEQKKVNHDLVRVLEINPNFVIDLRYATTNNFTKKIVPGYKLDTCFLRRQVAIDLSNALKEFMEMGYLLVILDAYRPHRIQYELWKLVPDPRYVNDPKKGSKHNRGCAVDVTLITINKKKVLMPTEFDNFTEKALSNYMDLPEEAIKNRTLLRTIMEKYNFKAVSEEWWHFNHKDWQSYPILDIPFQAL